MFSCLPTAVIRRTASVCRRRANVGLKDLFCGFRGRDGVPCAAVTGEDDKSFRSPLCRRSRCRTDPSRRGRPDQGRPFSPLRMTKMVVGSKKIASVCQELRIVSVCLRLQIPFACVKEPLGIIDIIQRQNTAGDSGPSTPGMSSCYAAAGSPFFRPAHSGDVILLCRGRQSVILPRPPRGCHPEGRSAFAAARQTPA